MFHYNFDNTNDINIFDEVVVQKSRITMMCSEIIENYLCAVVGFSDVV